MPGPCWLLEINWLMFIFSVLGHSLRNMSIRLLLEGLAKIRKLAMIFLCTECFLKWFWQHFHWFHIPHFLFIHSTWCFWQEHLCGVFILTIIKKAQRASSGIFQMPLSYLLAVRLSKLLAFVGLFLVFVECQTLSLMLIPPASHSALTSC